MSQSTDQPAMAAPAPSGSQDNSVWTDCAVMFSVKAAIKWESIMSR